MLIMVRNLKIVLILNIMVMYMFIKEMYIILGMVGNFRIVEILNWVYLWNKWNCYGFIEIFMMIFSFYWNLNWVLMLLIFR